MQSQTFGGFTCAIWVNELSTNKEVSHVTEDQGKFAFCIKCINKHQLPVRCVVDLCEACGVSPQQRVAFDRSKDATKQRWMEPSLMILLPPAAPGRKYTEDLQSSGVWKVSANVGSSETIYAIIEFTYTRKRQLKAQIVVSL
jgi:hypothetical protein